MTGATDTTSDQPTSETATVPPLRQTATLSFFCALFVFAIDLAFVYLSYARPFLHTFQSHLQLVAQAAVFTLLVAFVLTAVVHGAYRLSAALSNIRFISDARLAVWGFALFQLLLGAVIFVRSDIGVTTLEGIASVTVVLFSSAAIFAAAGYIRKHASPEPMANLLIVVALILSLWFLRRHFTLFVGANFGIGNLTGLTRTLIVFFVPFAAFWAFAFRSVALEKRLTKAPLAALSTGLVAALFALQYLSLTFYVDNYLLIHLLLSVVAYLVAWSLARIVTRTWNPVALHLTLRRAAVVGLLVLVASVMLFRQVPTTVGGYVGAVHTAHQRLVIDTGAFLKNAPGDLSRIARAVNYHAGNLSGEAPEDLRPVDTSGSLPSTFETVDTTNERPDADVDNVVIFFLDMKRPEDIGLYDHPEAETPGIDDCFDDSFVFERSYSPGNRSVVAFPAFHTGTYSATRGLIRYTQLPYWFEYQDGNNLASLFADNGFHTNLWTDSWYWREFFDPDGVDFETEATFGQFDHNFVVPDREGSVDAEGLRELLRENSDKLLDDPPSLEVFHIFSHPIDELPGVDRFIDEVCQEIRDRGEYDDTLFLLTADHGYQLREHGRTDYGHTMFDSEIRVPLLVRVPGMDGEEIDEPVGGVDHLATLADILKLDIGFKTEGQSYLPEMVGQNTDGSRILFSETRNRYHSTAMLKDDLKLIYWATPQVYGLFNVVDDPEEKYNLVDDPDYQERFESMKHQLHQFLRERGELNWRP